MANQCVGVVALAAPATSTTTRACAAPARRPTASLAVYVQHAVVAIEVVQRVRKAGALVFSSPPRMCTAAFGLRVCTSACVCACVRVCVWVCDALPRPILLPPSKCACACVNRLLVFFFVCAGPACGQAGRQGRHRLLGRSKCGTCRSILCWCGSRAAFKRTQPSDTYARTHACYSVAVVVRWPGCLLVCPRCSDRRVVVVVVVVVVVGCRPGASLLRGVRRTALAFQLGADCSTWSYLGMDLSLLVRAWY